MSRTKTPRTMKTMIESSPLPERGNIVLKRRSRTTQRPDFEVQHVGPRVMPGGVKSLSLREQEIRVELRVDDALLVPERPRQVLAVRGDDRGAAAAEQVGAVGERNVARVARRALEEAARK